MLAENHSNNPKFCPGPLSFKGSFSIFAEIECIWVVKEIILDGTTGIRPDLTPESAEVGLAIFQKSRQVAWLRKTFRSHWASQKSNRNQPQIWWCLLQFRDDIGWPRKKNGSHWMPQKGSRNQSQWCKCLFEFRCDIKNLGKKRLSHRLL